MPQKRHLDTKKFDAPVIPPSACAQMQVSEKLEKVVTQEATKDHFDMTTFIFSAGGVPLAPLFIPLIGASGTLFSWLVTENPSREVATKDHSS